MQTRLTSVSSNRRKRVLAANKPGKVFCAENSSNGHPAAMNPAATNSEQNQT
jgi:hypothetical protein